MDEGDLYAVGILEADVEIAPENFDGRVDEGRAVGERLLQLVTADQALYHHWIEAARAHLDSAAFESAWAAGQSAAPTG